MMSLCGECLHLRLRLFALMFAANRPIEINGTHLVTDADASETLSVNGP